MFNFHNYACVFAWMALLLSGCARKQDALVSGNSPMVVESVAEQPASGRNRLVSSVRQARTQLASAKTIVSSHLVQQPSHHKVWRPEYAVLPVIECDNWNVRISNIRDCRYRSLSDYDVRYYDLDFLLTDLQTIDYVVVPFQKSDFLAHTMLAFGLRDGTHFLVSVEARLERDEKYSTTAGLRNEFELMYVLGDERDLIPLRTRIRQVDCYLYPGRASPADIQKLFLDIVARVNQIAKTPEFYHTLTNNCTTNLVDHVNNVFPDRIPTDDWRLLLPGRSDRLAFELGLLNLPHTDFETTRQLYRINEKSLLFEQSQDFSTQIRVRSL